MPKIRIQVKPQAKQNRVERLEAGSYRVEVKAPADEGRANAAVIEALKEYFRLPKKCFRLTAGRTSRLKTIEISAEIEV